MSPLWVLATLVSCALARSVVQLPAPVFSCKGRADGFYAHPAECNRVYYSCWEGVLREHDCGRDLVFDVQNIKCVLPIALPICPTPAPPTPAQPPVFSCKGQADGFYEHPFLCQRSYFSCWEGVLREHDCGQGLVFDQAEIKCAVPETVATCPTQPPPSQPPLPSIAPKKGLLLPFNPPTIPSVFSCEGKADGFYEHPGQCNRVYFSCWEGVMREHDCGVDLVFDQSQVKCTRPDLVLSCPTPPPPAQPPVFSCFGKADGFYEHPAFCQRVYFSCWEGVIREHDCGEGLVFDQLEIKCVRPETVATCPIPPSEPTFRTVPPKKGPLPPFNPPTIPPTTPEFSCEGRADGFYVNPHQACSPVYYSCWEGVVRVHECDQGLMWDVSGKCDVPERVLGCGPVTPVPTFPPTFPPSQPTIAPVFSCKGQADGFYEHPQLCNRVYFSCWEGVLREHDCGRDLVFDVSKTQCALPISVPSCPTPPPPPPSQPTISPVFSCKGQADGFYEHPLLCQRVYFSCWEGVLREHDCGQGLVFDQSRIECAVPETVATCPTPPPPSQPTVAPKKGPLSPFNPPTIPPTTPEFSCKGRADGFYVNPHQACSPVYYSCWEGVVRVHECDQGLMWDVSGKCEIPERVLGCGGKPRPVPPSQPTLPPTVPTLPPRPTPAPAPEFTCVGRKDGQYEDPRSVCSPVFYTCLKGVATRSVCQGEKEAFDVISGRCDDPRFVPWCGGISRPLPSNPPTVPPTPEFSCLGRTDGFYVNPHQACSPIYYSCWEGVVRRHQCGQGLMWDVSGKCDVPSKVLGCGGQPTFPPTLPPSQPTIAPERPEICTLEFAPVCGVDRQTYSNPCHARVAGVPVASQGECRPSSPVFSCKGQVDGFYEHPFQCRRTYFSCWEGVLREHDCGEGLVFDQAEIKCSVPQSVATCPTPPPPSQPTLPSILPKKIIVPAPQLPVFECAGKADGFYAHPLRACSAEYFSCWEGVVREHACDSGLVWDSLTSSCKTPTFVLSCLAQKL